MITVKEVIKKSAGLLDIDMSDETKATLVECYNEYERDLARFYMPLRKVDKIVIEGYTIDFEMLTYPMYRLLAVYDFQNDIVEHKLFVDRIELKKNYEGAYFFVKYNYLPVPKTLKDNCENDPRYQRKNMLVYGTCAEWCNRHEMYKQAAEFSQKAKNEAEKPWWTK